MFYDFKIDLYKHKSGYINDMGVWIEDSKPVKVGSLKCDIQPMNNELAYKQYGYDGDVSYEIYCPVADIQTADLIKYDDKFYSVVVAKKWDDYMILVVVDKDE